MNAIQKFKQGRKIMKFQSGGTFTGVTTLEGYKIYKRPSKDGGGYYYIDNTPQKFSHSVSPDAFQKHSKRYSLNPDQVSKDKNNTNRIIIRNGVEMWAPKYQIGDPHRPSVSRKEDRPTHKTKASSTDVNKGSKTPQSLYYTSKYKGRVPEKLSSRDAVSNFQETYLKNYYAPGTYVPDGIWGDNTQVAYDRYLAALAQNVQPTAAPVVETSVVTPKVEVPEIEVPVAVQEYRPGIYNNEGYIPMAGSYTNVNRLYDYIINNPTSREAMLFNNAYGNFFNRRLFDRIMNQYGISGHLGRRDTKRLNGLLDLLKQIGTDGSQDRQDFINAFDQTAGILYPANPVTRFKVGGKVRKFQKAGTLPVAQKASERYKGGKKEQYINGYGQNVRIITGKKPNWFTSAPQISQTISSNGNDTSYAEIPPMSPFVEFKIRGAKNNYTEDLNSPIRNLIGLVTGYKKITANSPEYKILKKRFNEASLVSPNGKFLPFYPTQDQNIGYNRNF